MNACLIAYTNYETDFRVRRYAEYLADGESQVDVIALLGADEPPEGELNGVRIHRIQRRDFSEKGLFNYIFNYFRFMLRGTALLMRLHKLHSYKIIHIHNVPDFLVFMAAIPKWKGAKVILDIHDIVPEFFCQKFGKSMDSLLAKLLLFVERRSTRFAHHVIAANDIWREKLIRRNRLSPERCTTYLNYPLLKFFKRSELKVSDGHFKLVYPGTLSHQHGLDILVRAMQVVHREAKDIELHIFSLANTTQVRKSLDDLIRELGLTDVVVFHDAVPPEKLGKILGDYDVGVVPKRGGIFAGEAFSTKIFDFMAAGIPVIASRTKIDTFYFNDSHILFFHQEDHEDLARCILALYKDSFARERLVENGNKYIANNHWDLKKIEYMKLVEGLMG